IPPCVRCHFRSCRSALLFLLFVRTACPLPAPTLCPYPTLFRSRAPTARGARPRRHRPARPTPAPARARRRRRWRARAGAGVGRRSEEQTSELQSRGHLVCRLLVEKKEETENADELAQPDSRNMV